MVEDSNYPLSAKLPSMFKWPGGKSRSVKKLLKELPDHKTYVEPFVGAGSLFFAKPLAGKNVINDVNKGLVNFYKELRDDNNCRKLKNCNVPENDKEFDRQRKKVDTNACAFIGTTIRSYGGDQNRAKGIFNYDFKNTKIKKHCNEYQEKLDKAVILNQDYKKVFDKYDSAGTLTYLDPPYWATSKHYGTKVPHPEEVCGLAHKAKGKVMISYNNHPEVRKACSKGLKIKKVDVKYGFQQATTKKPKDVKELLITNY